MAASLVGFVNHEVTINVANLNIKSYSFPIMSAPTLERSALNGQPVPGLIGETSSERRRAQSIRSEAAITVSWLNSAQATKKAASSYARVIHIHKQLQQVRNMREDIKKQFGPDPRAWDCAVRQHEKNRSALRAAINSGRKAPVNVATTFPGDKRQTPEAESKYQTLVRQVKRLATSLNLKLRKFTFHPEVAYAYALPGSFSVAQNFWAGGMIPDRKVRGFQTRLNGWVISEADAVLALIRLDLIGELHKVALCEMCRKRWRVAAKSHYKFCSDTCRAEYYATSPDYHSKKAATQRTYRENKKQAEAARLA